MATRGAALLGAFVCSWLCGCAPLPESIEDIAAQRVPELGERSDHAHAPLALTATDGTELRLLSIDAEAVIEQPLAFTQMHLVFQNVEMRTIEGRFRIELPEHAAISRFAMKIGDAWQEGEVVERQAARQAYEDFLHKRQDPALLEREAGNSFGARVFPIGPGEQKELIVSYSQELPRADEPYRIALRGLPELASFGAKVVRREAIDGAVVPDVVAFAERDWTPTDDLVVASQEAPDAIALRHHELAVARITVDGDTSPTPLGSLAILFDTSASRAIGFDARIARLGELITALMAVEGGDFPLRVIAFDQSSATIHDGNASGFGHAEREHLVNGRALGASDLGAALAALADDRRGIERVIVVSDGIATAGATEIAELEPIAARLAEAGVRRIDAVLDGGAKDDMLLAALTTRFAARAGLVVDAELPARTIANKLARTVLPATAVQVPGADWVWPAQLEGQQPGDEVLIYADLGQREHMRIELAGRAPIEPRELAAERPLLERAWVRANIERLTARRSALPRDQADVRTRLAAEIVALSTEYRVLSDLTAMLVLERESDYERYGIGRRALADILAVGPSGTTLLHRSARDPIAERSGAQPADAALPDDGSPPAPGDGDVWGSMVGTEIGESYGVGGLGLVGTGRGGGGTGEGTIGLGTVGVVGEPRRRPVEPTVRMMRSTIVGALDPDLVRRVVRAHIDEVRACYVEGLTRDADVAGRISVQFSIGSGGNVDAAAIFESTLADPEIGVCIKDAVRRWRFPAQSSRTIATYPFRLAADGWTPQDGVPAAGTRRAIAPTRKRLAAGERVIADAPAPWSGEYETIRAALAEGDEGLALRRALAWRERDAGDVLALVALGEVAEALGDRGTAMRAYGSIIDLHPARADLRRFAGERIEALGKSGLPLVIDTYEKALASRPDHPSSHRLLAMAYAEDGRHAHAVAILHAALTSEELRFDRFAGAREILREDLAVVGAAWIAKSPRDRATITKLLMRDGIAPATHQTTRFVLAWETDANDVDFHIEDDFGGHAYYAWRNLSTGGQLLADVTTGYGPEQFAITGAPKAGPYHLSALYFSRGPMGFGMGALQIVTHDGKGELGFETRPFVIMTDGGRVDLGAWSPS
ncbi:MAG TPA: AgmX/PglI C-terminal domain-containing protein [Nannocystaceae bacterium]|nr:AgmX/PglI C-terminal domain-containing protein [Nannocystaceae bacterium]